jgi:hypothetical protein
LIRDYSVKTVGFKTCGSGTPENTYLTDFGKNVGDARSLFFLRAMLSYLPSFKELTNDKAIDSSLVWAPNVKSDTAALKEFCLLAFCHAVASSNFGEFKLEYGKHSWKVEDYFKKDGWLETSGLMTNIFHNFMRQADSEVATVCKAAMKTRNGDVTKLEELAEHRFQAAGFLPAGKKKKAG